MGKAEKKKKKKGLQSPGDTGICLEFSVGAKGGPQSAFLYFCSD